MFVLSRTVWVRNSLFITVEVNRIIIAAAVSEPEANERGREGHFVRALNLNCGSDKIKGARNCDYAEWKN